VHGALLCAEKRLLCGVHRICASLRYSRSHPARRPPASATLEPALGVDSVYSPQMGMVHDFRHRRELMLAPGQNRQRRQHAWLLRGRHHAA
jgi:hypothetical protein